MMDSLIVLMVAVATVAAVSSSVRQTAAVFSASHRRFHTRTTGAASLMALSYGDEVQGKQAQVFGEPRRLIPLRLDYHHRHGSHTADERRIVLCVFWPDIEGEFPEFPFAKVCR